MPLPNHLEPDLPRSSATPVLNILGRLRFPWLFVITATVFVIDLVVPDVLPFVDELLLGLATLVLAAWRKRKREYRTHDDPGAAPGDAGPELQNR